MFGGIALLLVTFVAATVGLALVGTLYGGLAGGVRGRETLLPLLLLPVVAPVRPRSCGDVAVPVGLARLAIPVPPPIPTLTGLDERSGR